MAGGIRDNNVELHREKRIYKEWYCKQCHKKEFTSHLVRDEHGTYAITPRECCGNQMVDWVLFSKMKNHRMYIIKDIDPYVTVAADKKTGQVAVINNRREHEEFLKRNEYIELGNEPLKPPKQNEKIVTIDDIGYAAAHCQEIINSDEYKEYVHKANKD